MKELNIYDNIYICQLKLFQELFLNLLKHLDLVLLEVLLVANCLDGERPDRAPRGDGEYRKRDEDKKVAPSGDFKAEFRGGIGRGAAQPQ